MLGIRTVRCVILALPLFSGSVRAQPASGLYQILSGRYTECCGFAGPLSHSLPYRRQAFVELTIDPQSQRARMAFLEQDKHAVFQIPSLDPRPGFTFSLSNGVVFPDRIEFGSALAPPVPGQPPLSYTVRNSADPMRISGWLTLPCPGTAASIACRTRSPQANRSASIA
jgi:hypothetical protein